MDLDIQKIFMVEKILVTGANGYLGKKLIEELSDNHIYALVRSQKAYLNLTNFIQDRSIKNVDVFNLDYSDLSGIRRKIGSCRYVVHLVGIIKETRANSFDLVHKQATQELIKALKSTNVEKIYYLSILGANKDSTNKCFASRAHSEKILLDSDIPSLILQIPMVLGEDDYASKALRKNALSKFNFTFRKKSMEQPIYAGDVVQVINKDINKHVSGKATSTGVIVLAGKVSLTREDLIKKAAEILGVKVKVFSLPIALGIALAWILEKLFDDPPVTRAMLGVLDHDDNVDLKQTCKQLDIQLTSLEDLLKTILTSNDYYTH